jgi:uncharacterized OB-fold protein
LWTFSFKTPTEKKSWWKNLLTGGQVYMTKKCKQCEKEFEPKDELDMFCGQECKEEALAELDSGSDECLSCQ